MPIGPVILAVRAYGTVAPQIDPVHSVKAESDAVVVNERSEVISRVEVQPVFG